MESVSDLHWRRIRLAAIAVYMLLALAIGWQRPGFNYDEAIQIHGAVHMLHSPGPPPFAHDPWSWLEMGGRHWQIMVVPYVGALKSYLLLPFAMFAPVSQIARPLSALFGAFGIWALGILLKREIDESMAALTCLVLAVQPSYVAENVFDYSALASWMLVMGLAALQLARVLKRRSDLNLLLLGLALGVGVWARVNFAWLLAAAAAGVLVGFRRRLVLPMRQWFLLGMGMVAGAAPLLVYEWISRGATWRALSADTIATSQPLAQLIPLRVLFMGRAFISDSEMRRIWGGPSVPAGLALLPVLLVVCCCLVCWMLRDNAAENEIAWRRATVVTFLVFSAQIFLSKLRVNEHHMDCLLPLAIAIVIFAFRAAIRVRIQVRTLGQAMFGLYLLVSLGYNLSAARGLAETGGVSRWSNGISHLAAGLVQNYGGRKIQIVDWGLQNNLFVVSNGQIQSNEIFWGAAADLSSASRQWKEALAPGDVFVINSKGNEFYPTVADAFHQMLKESGLPTKKTEFRQQSGGPFAEIIEVMGNQTGDPDEQAPSILGLFPAETKAGVGFNIQPDGSSALAVECRNNNGSTVVLWAGTPLTSVSADRVVTATVPKALFSLPGSIEVRLLNRDLGIKSKPVPFRVR